LPRADVRALRITGDTLSGRRFTLTVGDERARVALHLPGEHAVTTALAAAAVALSCGMSLPEVAAALEHLRPAKRRGEIKRGASGSTLVDDSYNANRQSAEAAIATLRGAKEDVRATAEAALRAGMPAERVHLFAAPLAEREALAQARLAAARYVRERLAPGDVVLVKGSLGVGMDAVVAELVEPSELNAQPAPSLARAR
jgi:UDP-N-acetylmuramoyl-tripeptide--D-alanyl-D-alanine ligase